MANVTTSCTVGGVSERVVGYMYESGRTPEVDDHTTTVNGDRMLLQAIKVVQAPFTANIPTVLWPQIVFTSATDLLAIMSC